MNLAALDLCLRKLFLGYGLHCDLKTMRIANRRAMEYSPEFNDKYQWRSGIEATFSEMDKKDRAQTTQSARSARCRLFCPFKSHCRQPRSPHVPDRQIYLSAPLMGASALKLKVTIIRAAIASSVAERGRVKKIEKSPCDICRD
jgi:hypothetical protein